MESIYYSHMESRIGKLLLAGTSTGLKQIGLPGDRWIHDAAPDWLHSPEPFREAVRQLEAYFEGKLQHFDLPIAPEGTPFQISVWRALEGIPYGATVSYGEIARRIQRPFAGRAVGGAVGKNPLPIVIPCHRVIGSNGSLTGYGGGLEVKKYLLALEREHALAG